MSASPAPSGCSLESGEWNDEDQSFYFDAHPTPYESFDPDQSFEGYQYLFTKPRLGHAATGASSSMEPLGSHSKLEHEEQEPLQQKQQERPERCCFNCGESDHAVAQCPHPRDRERIRQRRLEFEESKAQRGGDDNDGGFGEINGHARIHEQVASAEQRLRWLDEFVPGKPSQALVEALLPETDNHGWDDQGQTRHEQRSATDLPYLHRMLVWGYPPGWISSQDPIEQIRQRIKNDSQWDSVEVLTGFDVAALDKKAPSKPAAAATPAMTPKSEQSRSDGEPKKRWVDYQIDLFDSCRLQSFDTVYRAPLPQMQEPAIHDRSHDWERSNDRRSFRPSQHENERQRKRTPREHGEDERAALWKRLMSERSASPPPRRDERAGATRRTPIRIDRPHPYAPPLPPSPPPPLPPPPPPPSCPPPALPPPPPL